MAALVLLLRAVLALIALVPWLWLALFAVLAAAASLHLGRLPRYNNPDPKEIAHLSLLYATTSALLVPVIASPLAMTACLAVRSFVSPDIRNERWRLLAHALGYALAAVLIFGDVLGLGSWFLD
jgi:cation transporter-like permease